MALRFLDEPPKRILGARAGFWATRRYAQIDDGWAVELDSHGWVGGFTSRDDALFMAQLVDIACEAARDLERELITCDW